MDKYYENKTGFVASFSYLTEEQFKNKLNNKGIVIPENWITSHEGFEVIEDRGEFVTLRFLNIDEGDLIEGYDFEIDRDEISEFWA